ncbi:MAG: hypothetical protein NVS1B6_08570 [Steroidobacteraceae bacterium]
MLQHFGDYLRDQGYDGNIDKATLLKAIARSTAGMSPRDTAEFVWTFTEVRPLPLKPGTWAVEALRRSEPHFVSEDRDGLTCTCPGVKQDTACWAMHLVQRCQWLGNFSPEFR